MSKDLSFNPAHIMDAMADGNIFPFDRSSPSVGGGKGEELLPDR